MIIPSRRVALWGMVLLTQATKLQGTSLLHPARFGVINIVPNEFSGESFQDSEPSLGAGLNVNYGKIVVHTFGMPTIYTSVNSGDAPWTRPWSTSDYHATLDWSAAGT